MLCMNVRDTMQTVTQKNTKNVKSTQNEAKNVEMRKMMQNGIWHAKLWNQVQKTRKDDENFVR